MGFSAGWRELLWGAPKHLRNTVEEKGVGSALRVGTVMSPELSEKFSHQF